MKIIITEEQNQKLSDSIIEYLDRNLTPPGGWMSPQYYDNELEEETEFFISYIRNTDDYGSDNLQENDLWYSICDNQYFDEPLKKGECPLVTLPPNMYGALMAFFGNKWKPLFVEWFQHHTGQPVEKVELFDE